MIKTPLKWSSVRYKQNNELCGVTFMPCCTRGGNLSEPIKNFMYSVHSSNQKSTATKKKKKSPLCYLTSISVAACRIIRSLAKEN